jgi:EAL domain-containing protein (putative c-di-GMP-specific phosphodiesterase class I)/NO-binding membrane sensor protein with MHYT domain
MFSLPESKSIWILNGHYSIPIVVLSVVIACCASFTALSLNQRMQQNSFFHKNFWLSLSSIAMGMGIWSMHFIGMSAFMLPVPMKYNLFPTMISAVPAVLASYLAFYFANRTKQSAWLSIVAGIIMGIGISSMHYIGMAAMRMRAEYVYKPWIFAASIVIAIVVSFVALYIFSALQKFMGNLFIKLMTSVLMGLAITSMHYTGMASVVFYVKGALKTPHVPEMDMSLIIFVVTIGISFLLIISGLTSLLDRYVDYRLNYFDALTLFPNQRQFEKDLASIKNVQAVAVLHIHNLEKWINGYGYTFGDSIIKTVGDTLKSLPAKVYRIEGNRFALIEGQNQLKGSLEDISSLLMRPIEIDGQQHIVIETVCAISRSNGKESVRELFSNCMTVLQHPSIRYKHEVIEYDEAVHTYSFERQIVQDIKNAISHNELFLVYQPKVCSKSGVISGLEALIRWNHPKHGLISPGVFIPILEENGQIFDVTDWVIQEVCRQVSVWLENGVPFSQVSINIPGPYVTSPRLLSVIHDNLQQYQISSDYIELEITETSVIHDIENAITAVSEFRELGLSVALDDFGTGLSSLSYLRRIPISTIKIDKSFVDGVPLSEKDSSLLRAIITLCYSLNLKVVIEGVEVQEQMDFIRSITEKPHIQGYYYSRPLKEKELINWIRDRDSFSMV